MIYVQVGLHKNSFNKRGVSLIRVHMFKQFRPRYEFLSLLVRYRPLWDKRAHCLNLIGLH